MQEKTPCNLLSYSKNANNSKLSNLISHCVERFCDSIGFNRGYFFQFLPHISDKQLPKFFNSNDDTKEFKISDLEIILSNLDEQHKKPILDFLCQSNGFVCSDSAQCNEVDEAPIKDMLIALSAKNGSLANTYINSMDDDVLDDEEIQTLLDLSYETRQKLINFENTLRAVK